MSDQKDPENPLAAFNFEESQREFARADADGLGCAEESDSFYEGFDRPIIVTQPRLPADTLDQSAELEAEIVEQTALLNALKDNATRPPQQRKGTLTNPITGMTDEKRLIEFINKTRRVTNEKLEEYIVKESIPVMLWKLREFALQGRYTETRAIEIWLNWAAKISSRPQKADTDPGVLKNGALFDATLTTGQILEAQAQGLPNGNKPSETAAQKIKKPRSGNFSTAGDFIGKFRAGKKSKPKVVKKEAK